MPVVEISLYIVQKDHSGRKIRLEPPNLFLFRPQTGGTIL
ncbi:hypothetical protein SAMN04488109_4856 [Chryseolinea serpens]|uniref:Uncharacterized protein n=1 Tax=Chryseolinea serpens TaxID=947013 RepID=A0A1M5URD5_9BACT|nr:hypothetical protein SAMN04488109_4856 [Chryseolinea serpens]